MTASTRQLRVTDSLTSAGGLGVNEDLIGWAGQRCWVLDGATPVTPNLLNPESDARWLVEQVDGVLRDQANAPLGQDIADDFKAVALAIDARLLRLGFPDDALPPACSIGIAQLHHGLVRLAIVGDIAIYLPRQRLLLNDTRFGGREKGARARHPSAELSSLSVRDDIAARRRSYIYGPGDMYVLSRSSRVARGVRSKTVRAADVDEILIMSDGFTRLVDSYGVFADYADLADAVRQHGIAAVFDQLRDFESHGVRSNDNFKAADDASAIRIAVDK